MKFESIGLLIPDILLPNKSVDLTKWTVVACDQYSSEPEYWHTVEKIADGAKSAYNLIFPEAYLEDGRDDEIIASINKNMDAYVNDGTFTEYKETMIATKRITSDGRERKGLVVALDLEKYDYSVGSQTLIRATEGTIIDRIPPRVKIRKDALVELPHIMVLIDDPDKNIIEPVFENATKEVYNFDLMQNSGHLTGYAIDDKEVITDFAKKLEKLADKNLFTSKYNAEENHGPLLFAMGDGNHSLATAKSIWETLKAEKGFDAVKDSNARYALIELINLYDESLDFEPIHRVVFNVDADKMLNDMDAYYTSVGAKVSLVDKKPTAEGQVAEYFTANKSGFIFIENPASQLEAGSIQDFIDDYLSKNEGTVDYIHGEDSTKELGTKPNNIGILLPAMSKHALFKTVIFDGSLPRKTFSMGEAADKRFYLEARKIK